ncbi:benzoate 4-monooxygenase cytochrome [Stagonosporopsis vannaccii]|nr:benzoate 4-monooxygenase cytochrome [Stagonosporopsis vannaccii]
MASSALIILLSILISYLTKVLLLDPLFLSPLSRVPGPRSFALTKWRLAFEDLRSCRTRTIAQLHSRYGPAVRIGPNEVSFNSLGALKTIYGPGSHFGRTAFYRMFDVYGEQNLFTFHSSQEHGRRKKILSHAYSKSRILQEHITRAIEEKARQFLELIDREPNGTSDVFLSLHYYSLDNITHFIYGRSGATSALLGSKEDRALISDIMHPSRRKLSWCWVHIPAITKWLYSRTGLMKRAVKSVLPMQLPTTYTAIRKHALDAFHTFKSLVLTTERFPATDDSILAHLWKYHESQRDGGLNDMQIASECADHFLAGIDTTSDTLMFLVWALSLPENQRFQKRLRDEVLRIPGASLNDHALPRCDAADRCSFLQAVIRETLRLYAPLPSSEPRAANIATVVEGYSIPAGTVVGMSPWVVHRNAATFEDAGTFDPERWLGPSAVELNRWFWAFSSGGRMCIGMHLAMAEMTTLVAAIYRRYRTSIGAGFEGVTPAITARVEIFHEERFRAVRVRLLPSSCLPMLIEGQQENTCLIKFNT